MGLMELDVDEFPIRMNHFSKFITLEWMEKSYCMHGGHTFNQKHALRENTSTKKTKVQKTWVVQSKREE